MARGKRDLTLDQIDALIDGAVNPRVLIVAHWTWFEVEAARQDLKIRNNGGLNYRELNVWISDRTRIAAPEEVEWIEEP